MRPPSRRSFLRTTAAALGGLALPRGLARADAPASAAVPAAASSDARVDVLCDEPIGAVTAAHYGHFIEHLGGVIYDGVWVGPRSPVANVNGLRRALVDDLRALGAGVIRWPGGCFADSYDWSDGVGPRPSRPRRPSFWAQELPAGVGGDARYEPNQFGTQEFIALCRLTGAEPYLAVNGRSAPAQAFERWVDYCNAPAGATTLAERRAADGSREPFGVRYFGVGNEPWGCGGTLTAEEYAEEYRRMSSFVPTFPPAAGAPPGSSTPRLIAAGPLMDDAGAEAWTRRFVESLSTAGRGGKDTVWPWGYSLHSYFWEGDALRFGAEAWYATLAEPRLFRERLVRQADLLRSARQPVALVLDEWGPWYRGASGGTDPAHLFEQMPTLRDALLTAIVFDAFHAHADVLRMATVAQTINCLHSLFLARGERYVRTPVFHAFALYAPHIGGQSVRTVASAERIAFVAPAAGGKPEAPGWLEGISASATRHAAAAGAPARVVVSLTNPRFDQPLTATVRLRGLPIGGGVVTTLTHADPHAGNTFEAPTRVGLSAPVALPLGVRTKGDTFVVVLPPASVTRIVCQA